MVFSAITAVERGGAFAPPSFAESANSEAKDPKEIVRGMLDGLTPPTLAQSEVLENKVSNKTAPPPVKKPTTTPEPLSKPSPKPVAIPPTPPATLPPAQTTQKGKYKDGAYVGPSADAYYGPLQVQAIISGGKLTDVVFLKYPNDRQNSTRINQQAMNRLKQEAIRAQSAKVNTVSGATDSSDAFRVSLGAALKQALN